MEGEHRVVAIRQHLGEVEREAVGVRQRRQRIDEGLLLGGRDRFGDADDADPGEHEHQAKHGAAEQEHDPGARAVEHRERGRHNRDQQDAKAQGGCTKGPLREAHMTKVGGNPGDPEGVWPNRPSVVRADAR